MASLKYALPFLFLATVPLGFVLGGGWSFLTPAVTPAAICAFDLLLGFEDAASTTAEGAGYRITPILYIAAQLAVTGWAAMAAANAPLPAAIGLTLSVGVTAGIFGMLAAHEMVHSRSAVERGIGLTLLASMAYMHFRIAHIHGHHIRGATPEDPASARPGENAYTFIVRSIAGQAREAWQFEAAKLQRQGAAVFGLRNRVVLYVAIEIAIAAALAALSPRSLAFWLVQAAIAVIMLELFNYIAHYGLQRRRQQDRGYERLGPRHCWGSSRRMNNWALFNMGRHADHHRRPSDPYQTLEIEGPELPSGYAGAILMALIPPLWRRVMDPRVQALR